MPIARQYRDLTLDQSRACLSRNHVGRLAFMVNDRVDIRPIHYASEGDWIFGRTGTRGMETALMQQPWCAFEADEGVDDLEWSSVVVQGRFSVLTPTNGSLATYHRATSLLWTLIPGTFSAGDPAPQRNVIFGIQAKTITGRTARRGGLSRPDHA
ncbi:hypothetical protein BH11GEM1_BH11GEM1_19930 [soil metagenome]